MVKLGRILLKSETFYSFLGVSSASMTPYDLKIAYHKKSKQLHPDNQITGNHEEFLILKDIYNILQRRSLQTEYDIYLKCIKRPPNSMKDHIQMFEKRHLDQKFLTAKRTYEFGKSPGDFIRQKYGVPKNNMTDDEYGNNWSEWKKIRAQHVLSLLVLPSVFLLIYLDYKNQILNHPRHTPYQVPIHKKNNTFKK